MLSFLKNIIIEKSINQLNFVIGLIVRGVS